NCSWNTTVHQACIVPTNVNDNPLTQDCGIGVYGTYTGRRSRSWLRLCGWRTTAPWECTAVLGSPVEPEENTIAIGSAGWTSATAAVSTSAGTRPASATSSSTVPAHGRGFASQVHTARR